MLRFDQLRLFHSFSASHESICHLLKAAKCKVINFEAVESNLTPAILGLEGYQNLDAMCFEMDDTIGEEFFNEILAVSKAKKFIFHACDRIPQEFVKDMFEKWLTGSREIDSVRITTNQNFSFDDIISGLSIQQLDKSTWTSKNVKGDKATITMRRNNFHFFGAFEVNENHVEDILYKIPFIE
uniref:FBA_2 domain-containing protein n=1 Tax=Caenorhabditis tropicalis TaxID=1561998 RepID=A0A1I7UNJ0_9PELO